MSLVHAGYAIGGVDISKWQYPVNFSVLLPKLNFIIIRAGSIDGGLIKEDIRFQDYWRETRGFTKGAYWYFHPGYDPLLQAKQFVDTMSNVGMYTANMGLYIDLEEKNGKTPSPEVKLDYTNRAKIFIDYVDSKITTPFNKYTNIYTGNPYWTNYINYTKIPNLMYRTAWLAQYPLNYPMERPTLTLPGFSKLHMWQFSIKGGKPYSAAVGDGKKWGVYSYGLDMNVWLTTENDFINWFHCNPMPVDLTTTYPKYVKPFQMGYNFRNKPSDMSTVLGTTYSQPIEVMGAATDAKGRLWYQIGKGMWFAGWLGEAIY
jgi:GH25 family lysozyme M1 (1,4-beta-N-acetylmuramidase)